MALNKATKDTAIKGVILKIDSPGGGVTASDLVYRRILEYKTTQRVPVVACITNIGASGGYMVALSADRIVALPTSTVGNVGVLIPSISLEGLIDTLGIRDQTITSGKYKDAGSLLRDMSPDERRSTRISSWISTRTSSPRSSASAGHRSRPQDHR